MLVAGRSATGRERIVTRRRGDRLWAPGASPAAARVEPSPKGLAQAGKAVRAAGTFELGADLFRAAVLIKTGAIASQDLRRASDGEVSIEESFKPANKTGVCGIFRPDGPIDKMNRSSRSIHKTHWTPLPSEARICPCRNPDQNRFICAASMPRTICGGFMRYPRSSPCSEKCR